MALTITIPGAVETTTGSTAPAVLTVGVGSPGVGVPSGGTTGQVLQKLSATNYDTGWTTPASAFITSVTSPLAVGSGVLSVDLSSYLTTADAATTYYLQTNPDGFITSAALTGYATESFVTSQGYITQATADGLYYPLYANPLNFMSLGSLAALYTDIAFGPAGGPTLETGRLLITGAPDDGAGNTNARVNFAASATLGNILQDGDFARDFPSGHFVYRNAGSTYTIASQTYVNAQGFITSAALDPYAPLAGATFTGKVNMAAPTAGSASLNLGVGTAPTTSVAGDIWIATNINFRDASGTLKTVANTTTSNTFSQPQIIQSPLATTTAALRVTQLGTGNAIQVEDSTTPDATAFVVDQHGKVGVGTAPDATAAIKIDGNGMSFNGLVFNPTATAAHTGGTNTLDLLVTINGVNYRVSLRPA